jgi:sodium/potassium/calcium exchanger 6
VDFALLLDDPALAKKRRDTLNSKNEEKRRELRRTVLGMLEVSTVKDKMEGFNSEDHPELERKFVDMTGTEKVLYIVDYPFMVLSYLTILPTTEEHYSRLRCLIWPIPGTAFALWMILGHPTIWWAYIGGPIAVILLAAFFFLLPRDNSVKLSTPMAFTITFLGCVSSCCWMYFFIDLLIDLLNTIGVVFNLESSFLGFTVLAVGNALPDALNTMALAKQG